MIVLFINCKLYPFIDWIISGLKLYETRNRHTLKTLVGKSVYIAETGKHKRPVIRCTATIDSVIKVDNLADYNRHRKQTMIQKGSVFDWNPGTRQKYLYKLSNVHSVPEFDLPENAIYHGRVFATIN